MTLTSEEIAAIIGVLVVLGNAFAIWLSHQSTGKNIDQVSAKVDAVLQGTPTPNIETPPPPALVDGHTMTPHG